jgi:peptidoglycan/xylan/chitin deacetylase (PgdA/CDA1 family)
MFTWLAGAGARGGYRRYRVGWSGDNCSVVDHRCRLASKDLSAVGFTNPFNLYRQLVDALVANRRVVIRPLKKLMEPAPKATVVVGLRHDVDDDILTGLRVARYLARVGVPGSFYLLHISHYYGRFEGAKFLRHPAMMEYVRGLVVAGCEIGLHTDALGIYTRHGIDGAAAVKAEIAWLWEQGAKISGTSSHNSAPVYGAENFEIFKNRSLGGRDGLAVGKRRIPLGALDEKELGLTYEANYPVLPAQPDPAALSLYLVPPEQDAIRSRSWLEGYFLKNPVFRPGYDASVWLLGRDQWVIACHNGTQSLMWPADLKTVLEFLDECSDGMRIVFNIHPEYVSADAA